MPSSTRPWVWPPPCSVSPPERSPAG
jgi:hypothetical protein